MSAPRTKEDRAAFEKEHGRDTRTDLLNRVWDLERELLETKRTMRIGASHMAGLLCGECDDCIRAEAEMVRDEEQLKGPQ